MWGIARQRLHLSEDEFWDLGPDDLSLLMEANHEEYRRFYRPFAMIMAGLANSKDHPVTTEDFMPQPLSTSAPPSSSLTKSHESAVLAQFKAYQSNYRSQHGAR